MFFVAVAAAIACAAAWAGKSTITSRVYVISGGEVYEVSNPELKEAYKALSDEEKKSIPRGVRAKLDPPRPKNTTTKEQRKAMAEKMKSKSFREQVASSRVERLTFEMRIDGKPCTTSKTNKIGDNHIILEAK